MRGPEIRSVLKEGGAALAAYAAAALLLTLPSLFAAYPGTLDTEMSDSASAFVRGTAPSLEHSHTLFFGYPYAALPSQMAYYPIARLADRIFPADWTFPPLGFFHLVVAGLGLYATARVALRTRPFPAFVAGALLITCGFFTARRGQLHIVATASWMIWALAGAALALRRRRRVGHFIVAGSVALALLAGHSQIALYGMVMVGVSALFFSSRPRDIAAATLGAPLLGAGLAGISLLPALDLLRQCNRADIVAVQFDHYSFSPLDFLGFLIPGAQGGQAGHVFTRRYSGLWSFHESACYAGIAATGLALAFLVSRRRRGWRAKWLLTLLGVGFFISLGAYNPAYALLKFVPGFNLFRAPMRALLLIEVVLALGAALAFDRWLVRRDVRAAAGRAVRAASLSTAVLVAALVLWWGFGRTQGWAEEVTYRQPRPWGTVLRNLSVASHYHTPRLLVPLALAGLGWAVSRRGARSFAALMLADAFLFAFCVGTKFPETSPRDRVPAKPILEDARRRGWDPATVRILTDTDESAYLYHGLSSVTGQFALFPRELTESVSIGLHGTLLAWPPAERLPQLGISYVVSTGRALPPVPKSDLFETVVPDRIYAVPSAQPLVRPSVSVTWEPTRIRARLPAGQGIYSVDVLCRWDPSWRARLNGREVPIERAGPFIRVGGRDGAVINFSGGDLLLEYRNPAYARGRAVTGFSAVLFLLLALGAWKYCGCKNMNMFIF